MVYFFDTQSSFFITIHSFYLTHLCCLSQNCYIQVLLKMLFYLTILLHMLSKSYFYGVFLSFSFFFSFFSFFNVWWLFTFLSLSIFSFILVLYIRKLSSANPDVKLWDVPMSIYIDSVLEVLTVLRQMTYT